MKGDEVKDLKMGRAPYIQLCPLWSQGPYKEKTESGGSESEKKTWQDK